MLKFQINKSNTEIVKLEIVESMRIKQFLIT